MMTLRGAGAALLICLSSHYSVSAFLLQSVPFAKSSNAVVASTSMVPSSTQLRLFGIFNEAKKALVRSIAGDYDQTAIRARLDGLIRDSPVLFLSFETCPFCVKAKAILDEKKCRYTEVDLTKDPDGKAIRSEMGELLGRTSVPAIWIKGEFIGGCNDGPMGGIVTLNESGKLNAMLASAGAI